MLLFLVSFYYLFPVVNCHIINYISSVFVINSLLFIYKKKIRRGQERLCSSKGGGRMCHMAQCHNGQSKPGMSLLMVGYHAKLGDSISQM